MSAFDFKTHSDFVRVMCWSHVHRNLLTKSNAIKSDSDKEQIIKDVENLQIMSSPLMFKHATQLFVEKWSKSNDSNIIVFLKHFKTEWIESTNSGWYDTIIHYLVFLQYK